MARRAKRKTSTRRKAASKGRSVRVKGYTRKVGRKTVRVSGYTRRR